jgi:exopolysaccharide production protein ExoY
MPAPRFHSAPIDAMYLPPLDLLAERGADDPSHRKRPLGGPLKRVFDIIAASALLIVLTPLFLLLAYLVALGSPGPMLFRHRRVGLGGAEFDCLKFRTMQVDAERKLKAFLASNPEAAAEWQRDRKLRKDPRINMIGKFLRKTSLDELPQLLNVLRGEMSLVGPRPVVRDELKMYGDRSAFYLAARPGITGLWQTSGRNSTTYERRTQLDAHYVASWTFLGDIVLLVKTVPELAGWTRAF